MTPASTHSQLTPTSASPSAGRPPIALPNAKMRSWPIVYGWRRSWPILAGALAVAAVVYLSTGKPELAVLALALQWIALWRLWLPMTIEITPSGIDERLFGRVARTSWTAIREMRLLDGGALLVVDSRLFPMGRWRSIFVPFGAKRSAITTALEHLAPAHCRVGP